MGDGISWKELVKSLSGGGGTMELWFRVGFSMPIAHDEICGNCAYVGATLENVFWDVLFSRGRTPSRNRSRRGPRGDGWGAMAGRSRWPCYRCQQQEEVVHPWFEYDYSNVDYGIYSPKTNEFFYISDLPATTSLIYPSAGWTCILFWTLMIG